MKKLVLILVVLAPILCFSQSNCSKYYPFEEGTKFQYTNYSKKGKVSGTIDYETINYRKEGELELITMKLSSIDKKGNKTPDFLYDISCDGNGVSIDFKSLSNLSMFQQFEGLETEVTGENIIIPNELVVGQELPDSEMKMSISMAGMSMIVEVLTKDKKVLKQEKLSTSAGDFNCLVLQSTTVTKMMGKNMTYTTKSWISEGVGMIKQESFEGSNSLINSSELTKLER